MVGPRSETGSRCLRAASVALRIASVTSLALPKPTPTLPLRSPETTSALKLKRRPPFTTLAHRLMKTTFSAMSDCSRSPPRSPPDLSGRDQGALDCLPVCAGAGVGALTGSLAGSVTISMGASAMILLVVIWLEFQALLTGGFGECLHFAVIKETA